MDFRLCKITLLILVCLAFFNCKTGQVASEQVIVVLVPPPMKNPDSIEERYWRLQKLLYPQIKIPNPIPSGVPNYDNPLWIKVEKTGEIKIESERVANLSDTNMLTARLEEVFDNREKLGVYQPDSNKVETATGIKADLNLKYEDVLKVIVAVKASGADPIVLEIDELSR